MKTLLPWAQISIYLSRLFCSPVIKWHLLSLCHRHTDLDYDEWEKPYTGAGGEVKGSISKRQAGRLSSEHSTCRAGAWISMEERKQESRSHPHPARGKHSYLIQCWDSSFEHISFLPTDGKVVSMSKGTGSHVHSVTTWPPWKAT